MDQLRMYFLGTPHVELGGHELKPDFRKALALLVFLVVSNQKQRRETLMNLLWSEQSEAKARSALRNSIYTIRKTLPDGFLNIDRGEVGFDGKTDSWCDVQAYFDALSRCSHHEHEDFSLCHSCRQLLEGAVDMYKGDFLSGFSLKDSENFTDWQFFQSEKLRQEQAGALERICKSYSAAHQYKDAVRYAHRWLSMDQLNESAYRSLMRIYTWSGNRSGAIRQYEDCARVLGDELGIEPQDMTISLLDDIRNDNLAPPELQAKESVAIVQKRSAVVQKPLGSSATRGMFSEESIVDKQYVTTIAIGLRQKTNPVFNMTYELKVDSTQLFQKESRAVITRYGGMVNHMYGDRILAIFGENWTRESDPELALCAAMEIKRLPCPEGFGAIVGVGTG